MAFFDQFESRLNDAIAQHLGDGVCDYSGVSEALGVVFIHERGFEQYQNDGSLANFNDTIEVRSCDVPESRMGDTIVTPERTWHVEQILADDGYWRRLFVT